jgi:putative transcriptional regulator
MDKTLFQNLKQGLKEAAAIRRGELASSRVTEISAPDAKLIRTKVGLSQTEFAKLIGVQVATLRNWEQHRRHPTGAAAALLTIVEKEPDAALRALHTYIPALRQS